MEKDSGMAGEISCQRDAVTLHDVSLWSHSHRYESGSEAVAERRTKIALIFNAVAMVVEVAAGIVYNSMALQADGWHMFTHVGALGLAAFAYSYARKHGDDPEFAFGTGKVGALSGYTSAVVLLIIAAMVVWESVGHLISPEPISFDQAILVAVLAVAVNLITALVLGGGHVHLDHGASHHHNHEHDHHHDHHHHDDHHDHNLRAAYLHVLGDTLTSLLAIAALLAGRYAGLWWMDPVMGCVSSVVIVNWSYSLIKGSGTILLDRTIQADLRKEVCDAIEQAGDSWVADLHLWQISPRHHAAILSVVTHSPRDPDYYKSLIAHIDRLAHVTVEVNRCQGGEQCHP